ncbi:AfsR/SARP family transcriptional regulator [Actinoplanes aureus]|uniref:AfsR/SARP family transcriptional regulator n=1 Tax=Actinoplanes aureus TaxID=2792083 RepID=A0A931CGN3_9ACTN|nr:AfsR/SARP family transcriptional regulator [Actinoplanes aureus]MBG0564565.1 AfsR/SARP family transcriptional regulator [Actinoplanes aureus]
MRIRFGVLGPVVAEDETGRPVDLKGPMHRAVLARLLVARGRVVLVSDLVDDLWVAPPDGAVAAVRTFVAALRRGLEPDRPPRAPAALLITKGPGYALSPPPADVDAWRFEQVVLDPESTLAALTEALGQWRGPAYADFPDAAWARADRARLTELRLHAVERQAAARLDLGRPAEAVPDLDAHVTEHPWREEGWRLLATALYRSGRQADALAVLRRARELLTGQLGIDPGPALRALQSDILTQEPHLDGQAVWTRAAATYDRVLRGGPRLEAAVGLLRNLAVAGPDGLEAAREQRAAAVAAAEQLSDPELTARVIGAYDVPAIWTRVDDPEQAGAVVAAAERALAALPSDAHPTVRARLLATIAVESRGTTEPRPVACAAEAERIARELDDPGLLAFALNGVWMQSFGRIGQSGRRDAIGAELVALASRHALVTAEVLGHLIRMQARSAVAGFAEADRHAAAADALAARHSLPLVGVFTDWYRALRTDVARDARAEQAEQAYRAAAARLDRAGMPGMRAGLLPLALLGMRVQRGLPLVDEGGFGPYEAWVRPLLSPGMAVGDVPDPPPGPLAEALWCLVARAAVDAGDDAAMRRARRALEPAAGEWAGAGSGLLTVGPVRPYLDAIDRRLSRRADRRAATRPRPGARTPGPHPPA